MAVAGDSQRLRLSNLMLPLLLAFAQPLAAASASLRSMRAGRTAPDVCFIHVGKTGGDSVSKMLNEAFNEGLIASFMETHDDGVQTPQTWDHCKWYGGLQPSKCDGLHEGPTGAAIDFHAQCGDCLLNMCNATGHVVMWVRDPVSRLISIWNADSSQSLAGKGEAVLNAASELGLPIGEDEDGAPFVDLGEALDHLASHEHPLRATRQFISVDGHLQHDTNWFMGAEDEHDVSTCKALASSVNFACVGRTERFADDWVRCTSSGLGLPKEWSTRQPKHTHRFGVAGKHLSSAAVELVRDVFANELECMRALHRHGRIPNDGWLEEVLSPTAAYVY